MFGEVALEMIRPAWVAALPPRLRGDRFDRILDQIRPQVVVMLEDYLVRRWVSSLALAKRRVAGKLAEEFSKGYSEAALQTAIELKTPGAMTLWRDVSRLSAEERDKYVATLVKILRRGAEVPADEGDAPDLDLRAAKEERTQRRRAVANLAAMNLAETLKKNDRLSDEGRQLLRGYSGWGGLDLDRYAEQFPESWRKETQGLIHEYYTPTAVADAIAEAVCPLLESVATPRGRLTALEPSAGIGRFIDAFDRARCDAKPRIAWTGVELSTSSARLLRSIRPDVDLEQTSFEKWITKFGADLQGEFSLVVANPPYGERGETRLEDTHPEYKGEKRAAWYFMRRGLDILAPKGIGVFLVPGGFLTGDKPEYVRLRHKVLRRHHLSWAARLPGALFPGAGPRLEVDVLVFRSRGGELADVDDDDQFIYEGRYYEEFPEHDLSKIEAFEGLPELVERTECSACVISRTAWKRPAKAPRTIVVEETDLERKLPAGVRRALGVGRRVRRYREAVSKGDPAAADARDELLADLRAIAGDLDTMKAIRRLAEEGRSVTADALASAVSPTGVATLPEPGPAASRYKGGPNDIVKQADALYRDRRRLRVGDLWEFHEQRGGSLTHEAALAQLFTAGWNLDGPSLTELVPLGDYITGDLGQRKTDLAVAEVDVPANVRAQLDKQRARLADALSPAEFDEIQGVSPRQSWVPVDLVARWLSAMEGLARPLPLVRRRGLVQLAGTSYTRIKTAGISERVTLAIGWLNHDRGYFAPEYSPPVIKAELPPGSNAMTTPLWKPDGADDNPPRDELRRRWSVYFEASFYGWVLKDKPRMEAVTKAYNDAFRSFIPRTYSSAELPIARWGEEITLAPHQVAGARRVLAQRGGLLAFDVGVGKTFTAIGVVARARQEGWARRPVVVVPQTLLWKWKRDFERCLPDFRVTVIGSKLHQLKRGKRVQAAAKLLKEGRITQEEFEARITTSKTDTGKERAAKWREFQAGRVDVALVSYEALPRTQIRPETIDRYAEQQTAIMRSTEITLRQVSGKDPKKLTQRQKAVKEHGARGWLLEQLGSAWSPDPDVVWEELGVDLLVVDEAASYKNLYMAETREGGNPRYMGGAGRSGSKRAWAFDLRAAIVREHTGGAGVVLLSATPAKNSPLEFYNMIQYIDGGAWSSVGIDDPEQFIDRYCKIEAKNVVTPSFQIELRPAVVGFTNLDELRSIVYRYGEFRKALDVGIKLPAARVFRCEIDLDDTQVLKYQAFVKQIEAALEKGKTESVLGHLARLSLVALHADLDEGYTWGTAEGGEATRRVSVTAAGGWLKRGWTHKEPEGQTKTSAGTDILLRRELPKPDHVSPKFRAVAQRVAAQPTCGHIIFCEPTAAHYWIKKTLIDYGIPAERIAVINAEVTNARERYAIARAFNGEDGEPRFDVVIANQVANEGIDLQVRTCAIHHIDIPWTPADLEQRNGRGYRQGNGFSTLAIYYYLAKGSMDMFRFDLISGKAGWLDDLVAGNPATSNPAAQTELDAEDILIALSADPERTRALLAKKREEERLRLEAGRRERATRRLVAASKTFARLRKDPMMEQADELRERAEADLALLRKQDPKTWPFGRLIDAATDHEIFFNPPNGAPMHEGLILARQDDVPVEVGKPTSAPGGIYYSDVAVRPVGSARWKRVPLGSLSREINEATPYVVAMTAEEAASMETEAVALAQTGDLRSLLQTRFGGSSDNYRGRLWPVIGGLLAAAAAKDPELALPGVIAGKIALVSGPLPEGGELLPWTAAGFERAVELGRPKDVPWGDLSRASRIWWGRGFPRGVGDEAVTGEDEETIQADIIEAEARVSEPASAAPAPRPPTSATRFFAALEALEEEQRNRIRGLAESPEGYARLLATLESLAELRSPVDIVEDYPSELREYVESYVTQERRGRGDEEPWELSDFLMRLRDMMSDSGFLYAAGEVGRDRQGVLLTEGAVIRGDEETGYYVMREDEDGATSRYIRLLDEYGPYNQALRFENIEHEGNEGPSLDKDDNLYRDQPGLEDEQIKAVWSTYRELADTLKAAPSALEQARELLVIARELVEAPRCQGAAKADALRALKAASGHYFDAARRLGEGAHGSVYANLRRTSRFIADQAKRLAESCAFGQTSLGLTSDLDLANVSEEAFEELEADDEDSYDEVEE